MAETQVTEHKLAASSRKSLERTMNLTKKYMVQSAEIAATAEKDLRDFWVKTYTDLLSKQTYKVRNGKRDGYDPIVLPD